MDKFLNYHEGYLLLSVSMTRAALVSDDTWSYKNSNSFINNCIVNVNKFQVENCQYNYLLMDILNSIEYSHNFGRLQEANGYVLNDVPNGTIPSTNALIETIANNPSDVLRKRCYSKNPANNSLTVTVKIPFTSLANIFRSIDFPIINNEISIEFRLRSANTVFRNGGDNITVNVTSIAAYVPQVELSEKYAYKYASGNLSKTVTWLYAVPQAEVVNIATNNSINHLVNANIDGIRKLLVFITDEADWGTQTSRDSTTIVPIDTCNIIINNENFFKDPISEPVMFYNEIKNLFNSGGQDLTTGPLLSYNNFMMVNRYYCFDLKRQEAFELDPRKNQTLRFTAINKSANAITRVIYFMMKERQTVFDMQNPTNTKTF